jgi:hypothetical protein
MGTAFAVVVVEEAGYGTGDAAGVIPGTDSAKTL